jgi:beta-galactosidase
MVSWRSFWCALAVLGALAAPSTATAAAPLPAGSHRVDLLLDQGWTFHFGDDIPGVEQETCPLCSDPALWTDVTLPHTWNVVDGSDGGDDYARGGGWYRKHLTVDPAYAGRRLFLQFDGASMVTDVYVDGVHLGTHAGGFARFRFDATPYLRLGADNVLAVRVSNAPDPNVAPLRADFTFFGGLYRSVHLVVTDAVHVSMLDYGSSGVYLTQSNVSAASADLQITTKVDNDSAATKTVTLDSVILDAAGATVATLASSQSMAAGTESDFVQTTTIANPHLWDGKKDPYLYTVDTEVLKGGNLVDLVTQPLGFRSIRIDPNLGFFLNGHYLDLHGVNLHQDHFGEGWAVSDADIDGDFKLVREVGANMIRMSHYEHPSHLYDLADRYGLIVWDELPLIDGETLDPISNRATPAFTANVEQQLTELIRQDYNHPSIVVWSIANEIVLNGQSSDDLNPLLGDLNALAHTEDPGRPTTLASNAADGDVTNFTTDVVAFNKYYGWYSGTVDDFAPWADAIHAAYPSRSIGISEYGAGSSVDYHSYTPTRKDHTEEYQDLFHEAYWNALKTRRYLWCKVVWTMFDFASDARDEGESAGINDKGLVTYDRKTKKDAFYFYKANWTTKPFVYITSRRFNRRTKTLNDVKVYSNTASVELDVNGVSLGSQTGTNGVFVWPGVRLATGANTVEAIGTSDGSTYTDSVRWTMHPELRIDVGGRRSSTDVSGHVYTNDTYGSGGTTGSTTQPIGNTGDGTLYQTYRSGTFSYDVPVDDGTYRVTLEFVEPDWQAPGMRVFDVFAEGKPVLANLDVYAQAGYLNAIDKTVTVTVADGVLDLRFKPSAGQAIVSGITLVEQ